MAFEATTVADAFRVVDLTGVFANAILGGVIARRQKLDLIGFAVLATLSGLGGGLIRDTLLQSGPPTALTDFAYLTTALAGAALTFLFRIEGRVWNKVWPIIDALALGCWAATGAQKALAVGLGWLPALLLGTITAVGGGAIRDVVLRQVPGVLGGNTLYATCALVAAGVQILLTSQGQPTIGLLAATLTGTVLCLLARWRRWILPDADAWSPRLVRVRYRSTRRSRRRAGSPIDDDPEDRLT